MIEPAPAVGASVAPRLVPSKTTMPLPVAPWVRTPPSAQQSNIRLAGAVGHGIDDVFTARLKFAPSQVSVEVALLAPEQVKGSADELDGVGIVAGGDIRARIVKGQRAAVKVQ